MNLVWFVSYHSVNIKLISNLTGQDYYIHLKLFSASFLFIMDDEKKYL